MTKGRGCDRISLTYRSTPDFPFPITPAFFSFDPAGFSVEEEDESELDDAVVEAKSDDGDDRDDVLVDLSSSSAEPSEEPKSTTPKTAEAAAVAAGEGEGGGGGEVAATAAPPKRRGVLKRAASVATGLKGDQSSAPAPAMTTSPALAGLNRRSDRNSVVETYAEAEVSAATALRQAASVEDFAGVKWGDDSPPARLSRSLSASVPSATTAWGGAAAAAAAATGCAKFTRSSHRRRSRANSTSSPLPVLETSASLPTGGVGLEDAAAGVEWTTRSFGSGGFARHGRRRSYGGDGGSGGSTENLPKKALREGPAAYGSAPLARSHRMPAWNQGNVLKSIDRPTSLPSGIAQRAIIPGVEGLAGGDASCIGGDAGFGWVLRSPGAPLDHRRRSQSFAGGRASMARSRSASNSSSFASVSGARERPPGLPGASDDEYGFHDAWTSQVLEGHEQGPIIGDAAEDNDAGMSPAQTPQASPSKGGTSAALRRAHGLSSMARRMDRLEIRSPDVETHAAEVLL